MYQNGRQADPDFSDTEKLYFRCKRDWISEAGQIKPADVKFPDQSDNREKIRFPDQSVNREKYSRPGDVLLPDDSSRSKAWLLWGVAAILVHDIPDDIETNGNVKYSFTAEHDPISDNYGHTELRVYKNGQREKVKKKINSIVKKEYRTTLALRARVIVQSLV